MKAFAGRALGPFSKRCAYRSAPVPNTVVRKLRHGDLLFASEPLDLALPLDRAISAVGASTTRWLRERGVDVKDETTAEHVAMVVADASGQPTSVVEAVRLLGVRVLPLEGFFNEFIEGTSFLHGRVEDVSEAERKKAVSYALLRSGAPYSDDFSPPSSMATTAWTQAFYCSSLVDYAYRHALGKDLVFTPEPFPLVFDPPEFWEMYYKAQGKTTPSGYGSNPTMLLHSARVKAEPLDFFGASSLQETHELF